MIVAFHRPDQLRSLLSALADSGASDIEIVVVNVEDDPAVAAVATASGARIVPLAGNPGFAGGVNRGTAAAAGDVIVFTNDDIVASRDAVRRLAGVVAGGEADVAVPMIVDASGNREPTIAALPSVTALAREWLLLPDHPVRGLAGLHITKWRTPTQPEAIPAAQASMVAVRRSVLERRPVPEDYFLYWEESEWFWWLRHDGMTLQYRPDIAVTHTGGRADIRPDKARLMARNAVRCIRRTQGRGRAAAAIPIVIAWNLRLFLTALVRRRHVAARWAGVAAAVASVRELR